MERDRALARGLPGSSDGMAAACVAATVGLAHIGGGAQRLRLRQVVPEWKAYD